MATKRILRCNPWHEGGVDPVPATDCLGGHSLEDDRPADGQTGH
jgi:putative component of membrane protein insertase Oxa1/YidC/SpoIIIJ protein YidD